MSQADQEFISQTDSDKALVLLLSDSINEIVEDLNDFLISKDLDTIFFSLDDDLGDKYQVLEKKNRIPYKMIFIYGFNNISQVKYQKAFDFFSKLGDESPALVSLLAFNSHLKILDDFNPEYELFIKSQEEFLEKFFKLGLKSLTFLAEDLLLDQEKIDYPFRVFLTALNNGYLLDPQHDFYWQNSQNFLDLVEKEILKPHQENKFLIRGKKNSSSKLLAEIKNLYYQYFQNDLKIIKIFAEKDKQKFLDQFKKVTYSPNSSTLAKELAVLVDKRVRFIPKIRQDLKFISPSESEIVKAITESKKILAPEPLKAKKQSPTPLSESLLSNDQKQVNERAKEENKDLNKKTDKSIKNNKESEIDEEVTKLFSKIRSEEKEVRKEKKVKRSEKIIEKSRKRSILFYGGMLSFSLAFIVIILYSSFAFAKNRVSNLLFQVVDSKKTEIMSLKDKVIVNFLEKQYQFYTGKIDENLLTDAKEVMDLKNVLIDLSVKKRDLANTVFSFYQSLLGKGVENSIENLNLEEKFKAETEIEIELLSQLNALNLNLFSEEKQVVWDQFSQEIKLQVDNSLLKQRFLLAFTDFIRVEGRKNILVLTQDNSILRSTGGILDTAIFMTFDNTVLLDKQIIPIEEISEEVYGEKEAYQNQTALLGEANLTLKNSNWLVDFEKSNRDITWFIEQARGEDVDLTILLNTKTLDKLVALNIFENQDDFAAIFDLSEEDLARFLSILFDDLSSKEIYMQSNDKKLEESLLANVWTGKKLDVACPTEFQQENCFLDYIYQVENTVSRAATAQNISQKIEHNLGVGRDFIRHKRKITFKNISKKESLQGKYEDYLQLYLPKVALIEKVLLNGNEIASNFYDESEDEQHKIFSILLEIPSESEYQFEITYLIKNQMISPFSYVFLEQKQAGINDKKLNYNIVFDELFKPQLIAPKANYKDQIISFSRENNDNFLFAVSFD